MVKKYKRDDLKSTHDLSHTIEFTSEDRKKLRDPNPQPIDGDYFTQSDDLSANESSESISEPFESNSTSEFETPYNEFRYVSIREQLKEQAEAEASNAEKRNWIQPSYEEHYDMNQLDDIQAYNQFEMETNQEGEISEIQEDHSLWHTIQMKLNLTTNQPNELEALSQNEENETGFEDTKFQKTEKTNITKSLPAEVRDDADDADSTDRNWFKRLKSFYTGEYLVEDESEEVKIESEELDPFREETSVEDTPVAAESKELTTKKGKSILNKLRNLYDPQVEESEETESEIEVDENIETDVIQEVDTEIGEDNQRLTEETTSSLSDEAETEAEAEVEISDLDQNQQEEQGEGLSVNQLKEILEKSNETINQLPSSEEKVEDESTESEIENTFSHIGKGQVDKTEDLITEENSIETTSATEMLEEEPETIEPIITEQRMEEDLTTGQLIAEEVDESLHDKRSIVGGATWLTMGSVFSRIIGALYIIPWASMFGESYTKVNILYSIGYKPYALFLAIATAGFPSAIAKQMSYFHAHNEYKVANKLFKNSLYIMIGTGIVSALILFITAPWIASMSATQNVDAATTVIRSLTPALLILPGMSLLRGYFQGFNDMKQTAISQILEQLARVAYLLVATYAILKIQQGEPTTAVVHSTFAAFIGAILSLGYLLFEYFRYKPQTDKLMSQSSNKIDIDFNESMTLVLKDSIPFILLGSGIIIAQFIDQLSFGQILSRTSSLMFSEISQLYGLMSLDIDKLVMIIISVAVALASSLVPTITSYYAKRNLEGTSEMVTHIMSIFFIVMLPAALGMAAIANNLYFFFFEYGIEAGPNLLVTGAISSVILGLYTVLSTILQSMNQRRLAVRYLLVGLLVKLVVQFPMVALLKAHGALIATMIGFTVTSTLSWIAISKKLKINYDVLLTNMVRIFIASITMTVAAVLWNQLVNVLIPGDGRWMLLIKIMIVVFVSVVIYVIALGLLNLLHIILGNRYQKLQDEMRFVE
ncbi:polysaccharide biosynthesis C-terminal domain-containing protein [Falseniella ignava]|uniref:Uncharacterized protein n=1 Tax=Falseniella ignava CCUG 37419 TaxID=883112 RepID=K1M3I1_9LACT|nr:polysaccharide biosynthesis C-terminal domain-containing protein [Falseniella ignava]EKB56938.1 hypothetical protein HMPREF9707_00793 [Falseniella ignava CCUG 37419]